MQARAARSQNKCLGLFLIITGTAGQNLILGKETEFKGMHVPVCTLDITHLKDNYKGRLSSEYQATVEKEGSDKGSYHHFLFSTLSLDYTSKCIPQRKFWLLLCS